MEPISQTARPAPPSTAPPTVGQPPGGDETFERQQLAGLVLAAENRVSDFLLEVRTKFLRESIPPDLREDVARELQKFGSRVEAAVGTVVEEFRRTAEEAA